MEESGGFVKVCGFCIVAVDPGAGAAAAAVVCCCYFGFGLL